MYQISQLAKLTGLSRTALLYYEKLGLIRGHRLDNGYRSYQDSDVQRVRLIQQLQAGGLSLKECQSCLDAKLDRALLQNRLNTLQQEIAAKQQAEHLLSGLLGHHDLNQWHQQLDAVAPDAHLQWLITQGFDEKAALRLKWLSKDMNQHDQYMADFMAIFDPLERWGPGSPEDSLRALHALPHKVERILEVGCGNGLATELLAAHTQAQITAVDNEQGALDRLQIRAQRQGFSERLKSVCASMTELPFADGSFDLIWCEGSAYIMGVESALKQWRRLLPNHGLLVFSDLVWLSEAPSEVAKAFWAGDYPDMTSVDKRIQQIEQAGYQLLSHFSLSRQAWDNYSMPLQQRITLLQPQMAESQALANVQQELSVYADHLGEFGYQLFVLQKR